MRVVFVIPSMRGGGAERVFSHLLGLWDRSKDDVYLVVLRKEGPYLANLPSDLAIHELGGGRFLLSLPRLVRLIRTLAPDVVLGTQAHVTTALGLLRGFWPRVKMWGRETSMPSLAEAAKGTSWLGRQIHRWGYRRLDGVICPSQAMADELSVLYGISQEKLPVIPNPVRLDTLSDQAKVPLSNEWVSRLGARSIWLGAVGRFEPAKGFDLLLSALALLPSEIGLVLVGEGRLRSELEAQVVAQGLSDRVIFTGFQANPHQFLDHCRAFVLSSRYEGLPNAALEALALGLPVAGFDGPWGAGEVILPGVTGVLAQPFEPADLARAIQTVLATAWDVQAIQTWARSRYEARVVVARYREVLE